MSKKITNTNKQSHKYLISFRYELEKRFYLPNRQTRTYNNKDKHFDQVIKAIKGNSYRF